MAPSKPRQGVSGPRREWKRIRLGGEENGEGGTVEDFGARFGGDQGSTWPWRDTQAET